MSSRYTPVAAARLRRFVSLVLLPAAIAAAAAPGAVVSAQRRDLTTRPQTTVPDLTGSTLAAATERLKAARLVLGKVDTTYSADPTTRGTVIAQDPVAKTVVVIDQAVAVTIRVYSPGTGQQPTTTVPSVQVPELRKLDLRAAEESLRGRRLLLRGVRELDQFGVPAGVVLDQTPAAGAWVLPGSGVAVAVASRFTEVPSLSAMDPNQIQALLAQHQLVAGERTLIPSEAREGTIVDQQPAAGQRVRKGTAVSIYVATPVLVQVPELRGTDVRNALQGLSDARLRRGSVGERDRFDVAAGTVLEQRPAAGLQVRLGSPVNLWVASEWTEVPSLSAMDQNQIKALLARHQLVAGELTLIQSEAREGTIVGQQPAAGQGVRKGTAVSISVATPVLVTIPDLLGHGLFTADSVLASARLRRGSVVEVDRFDVPAGVVLEQRPPPGALIRIGFPIDIMVASAWTEVPSLEGADPSQVGSLLARRQLVPGELHSTPSEAREGSIIGQQPVSGQRVRKGSQVSVDVAGPVQVPVPDLLRLDLASAERALAGVRLRRGDLEERDQFDVATGMVLEQRPAAGTLVPAGTGVVLAVASRWTVVPSLAGNTRADADSLLVRNQLVPGAGSTVEGGDRERLIVSQTPAAGQRVLKGSAVSFEVGAGGGRVPPWLIVLLGIAAAYGALALTWPPIRPTALVEAVRKLLWPPPPPPPPPPPAPPTPLPRISFRPEAQPITAELLTPSLVGPYALELAGVLESAASDYDLRYSGTLTAGGEDGH